MRSAHRLSQGGFSMIEVLIALVVLGIGLLGLGLLQTINLRYTQGAQQRTQAVNLAGSLLDTMRANRSQVELYAMTESDFDEVSAASGCPTAATMNAAANILRWQCKVKELLGPTAWAEVDVSAAPVVTIVVAWAEDGLPDVVAGDSKQIELVTTL